MIICASLNSGLKKCIYAKPTLYHTIQTTHTICRIVTHIFSIIFPLLLHFFALHISHAWSDDHRRKKGFCSVRCQYSNNIQISISTQTFFCSNIENSMYIYFCICLYYYYKHCCLLGDVCVVFVCVCVRGDALCTLNKLFRWVRVFQ